MRFCSRCGFPLEGAMTLLANGGMLPRYDADEQPGEISPRRKGVRQGAFLLLAGAILVPMLGIINAYTRLPLEVVIALAAVFFFIGGPLRMLYAAIFEEGAPGRKFVAPSSYAAPAISPEPARLSALPPSGLNPIVGWGPRPQTAELVQPNSVTDNTTRLLDKSGPDTD